MVNTLRSIATFITPIDAKLNSFASTVRCFQASAIFRNVAVILPEHSTASEVGSLASQKGRCKCNCRNAAFILFTVKPGLHPRESRPEGLGKSFKSEGDCPNWRTLMGARTMTAIATSGEGACGLWGAGPNGTWLLHPLEPRAVHVPSCDRRIDSKRKSSNFGVVLLAGIRTLSEISQSATRRTAMPALDQGGVGSIRPMVENNSNAIAIDADDPELRGFV
jgi:hypothetical protein